MLDTRIEFKRRRLEIQDEVKLAKDDAQYTRELLKKDVDGVQDDEARTEKEIEFTRLTEASSTITKRASRDGLKN
jgi:hypothetical protein